MLFWILCLIFLIETNKKGTEFRIEQKKKRETANDVSVSSKKNKVFEGFFGDCQWTQYSLRMASQPNSVLKAK